MTQLQWQLGRIDEMIQLLEGGWCQTYWAVDKDGKEASWSLKDYRILPDGKLYYPGTEAVAFSLEGAFARVFERWDECEPVISIIEGYIGTDWVKWNDKAGRTKDDVLALLRKTRKALEKRR
jgi:hypothetical protein